jgi:hypothetical protein
VHTVKDQSLATCFSVATQNLSSRVSRPFYIVFSDRQQLQDNFFALLATITLPREDVSPKGHEV